MLAKNIRSVGLSSPLAYGHLQINGLPCVVGRASVSTLPRVLVILVHSNQALLLRT